MMNWKQKLVEKLLWALKPVMLLIDKVFTSKYVDHHFSGQLWFDWQPKLKRGMVFVCTTYGEGSNLINPSDDKHGAIFFGTGLRSALDAAILKYQADPKRAADVARLTKVLAGIREDIPYVLEALSPGVVATDVITFLTHKDKVKVYAYSSVGTSEEADEAVEAQAGLNAVLDLGKPYDFGFSEGTDARYCFELVAAAYLKVAPNTDFPRSVEMDYETFQSISFTRSRDFVLLLDSESH